MRTLFSTNKKIKSASLLSGLVAISILTTLFILLLTSYQSEKESLVSATLSMNYSKAKNMSETTSSLFRSMRSSLLTTSEYLAESIASEDDVIQRDLELIRSTNRFFNSLTWIDSDAVVRDIAPISVGLKGQTITSEQTLWAVESKKAFTSVPYITTTGRLILLLSEPFYDNAGTYQGIIGGTIYLQEMNILHEILGQGADDEFDSYYYVVDNKGKLLYHPDRSRIGEDVNSNPIVQKILQGKDGMEQVTNSQGIDMAAAYSIVPEAGWGIVQQTTMSSIQDRLFEHMKRMFLYTLAPFLLLLFLAISLAERLTRPFVSLATLMKEFSSGRTVSLPPVQPHWNLEADYLTRTVTKAIDTIQKNQDKLEHKALTDPLTGLSNRRALSEIIESWSLKSEPYSLMMIDIDHFKHVNDTYGHPAGDEVLKQLAISMGEVVQARGRCFRYGGEEFVVLLPNLTAAQSFLIAEELRKHTEETVSPVGKPITISIGIAEFPSYTNIPDKLLGLADQALYQSKNNGRNQTTISKPLLHILPTAYQ